MIQQPLSACARWYASIGLHPLRLQPAVPGNDKSGKRPLALSWQTTPLQLEALCAELERQPANLGLRMGLQPDGRALVALDVDDEPAFAALCERLSDLPSTMTTATGKGKHLIFTVPPELLPSLRNFTKRCGTDLRHEGGQVAAWPSVHYSGKLYTLSCAMPPAPLPEDWQQWLRASSLKQPSAAASGEPCPRPRDDRWMTEAWAYIQAAQPDSKGSEGLTWKRAAYLVRGLELSEASALNLLAWYNARSDAPLPHEKLMRDVQRAAAAADMPWGFARPLKPGSLNHANSPEELQALAPVAALASVPSELAPPPEFAPKVVLQQDLTAIELKTLASKQRVSPAIKLLADGHPFTDVRELGAALKQLANAMPDGVEWSAHSVAGLLQHCWVGDGFNLAEAWSNILQNREDGGVGLNEMQETLWSHPAWQGCLGFDDQAQRIVWRKPPPFTRAVGPFKDSDVTGVRGWFEARYGVAPGKDHTWDVLSRFAEDFGKFNPLQDWLQSLCWDGQPRLDGWLVRAMGAESTEFNVLAGSKWMISAVARAMQPVCQVDHALVLQGAKEGEGKSTVFRQLAVKPDWFAALSGVDLGSKESRELLRGKWIVCFDELASLRRSEKEAVKSYVADLHDDYRPAYGRETQQFPRRCVFSGTVNDAAFLDDEQNRRWWPVSVQQLDLPWLLENRDQLWAEAFARFKGGENFWKMPRDMLLEAAEPFKSEDPMQTIVEQWLRRATDPKPFTLVDCMAGCNVDLKDRNGQLRLGLALRKAGCEKRQTWLPDGKNVKLWHPPQRD